MGYLSSFDEGEVKGLLSLLKELGRVDWKV
jgi:hypothetical protein